MKFLNLLISTGLIYSCDVRRTCDYSLYGTADIKNSEAAAVPVQFCSDNHTVPPFSQTFSGDNTIHSVKVLEVARFSTSTFSQAENCADKGLHPRDYPLQVSLSATDALSYSLCTNFDHPDEDQYGNQFSYYLIIAKTSSCPVNFTLFNSSQNTCLP